MSSVRPLRPEDLPDLRRLFREYPHKALQQRFQGLDAEKLADFFTQGEKRRLETNVRERRVAQWVAESEDDGLSAFAALHADVWHSKCYPYRFGRIAPFQADGADREARDRLIDALLDRARDEGYEHLTARVDGAEYGALHALEKRGFLLVDSSVKLSVALGDVPDLAPPSRAAGMRMRRFRPEDTGAVAEIASTSHDMNHFHNDPWLKRADNNRLFAKWVERCCDGLASDIFVLERQERIDGFVVYLNPAALNKSQGTRLLILDFVCLGARARGGGLGRWLVSASLRKLAETYSMMELRTGHQNYAALTCYQSLGMRIVSTDFILHAHTPFA